MTIRFNYLSKNNELIIRLTDPIGVDLSSWLQNLLADEEWEKINKVMFDFKLIVRLQSSDLGELSLLRLDAFISSRELCFINVTEKVKQQLEITGLGHFAKIKLLQINKDGYEDKAIAEISNFTGSSEDNFNAYKNALAAYQRECRLLENDLELAQEEASKYKLQLQHSDKISIIGKVASGVAHEFNNLIAIMTGYAELALCKPDDEVRTKEALEVIMETCERASKVTQALLNYSRRTPPAKKMIDLNEILSGQLNLLHSEILAHKVEAKTNFAPEAKTFADGNQIEQVLLNLITNALHSMSDSGGILTLGTAVEGNKLIIKIGDTGDGISKINQTKIFDPFFTTKGAFGGGTEKGTGLGLSVSHGIMASHKGSIVVESEEGNGATFILTLPLVQEQPFDPAAWGLPEEEIAEEATVKPLVILVVDDEKHLRKLFFSGLTNLGHEVYMAENGEEAIEICKEKLPDLLFLDILMPGMNGTDTLLQIRRIKKDIKTVIITGQAGKSLEAMLQVMNETGNVEILRKPFKLEDVYAIAQKVACKAVKNNDSE